MKGLKGLLQVFCWIVLVTSAIKALYFMLALPNAFVKGKTDLLALEIILLLISSAIAALAWKGIKWTRKEVKERPDQAPPKYAAL